MYTATIEAVWERIENYSKKYNEIDGNEIEALFTTHDFNVVANKIAEEKVEKAAQETYGELIEVKEDVKKMIQYRQSMLGKVSDNCRNRLLKENINIEFPKLPEFEFATTMSYPNTAIIQIEYVDLKLYQNISDLFKMKHFSNISIALRKKFGNATVKDYKRDIHITKKDFLDKCEEKLRETFENIIYKNKIAEKLQNSLIKSVVDKYMDKCLEEIKQVIDNMNETYNSCIKRFCSAVDDRDKYKDDIKLLNLRKSNIKSIGECTNYFMEVWNNIIYDIDEEAKEKFIIM